MFAEYALFIPEELSRRKFVVPIVNLNTFDELGDLANRHEWLLLDFWAPWCAPCKVMNPVMEQFSELNQDTAVIKVDVDQKQEIAAKFGVRAIPTLVLLRRDQFMGQETGSKSLKDLANWIDGLKQKLSQLA
ncbi:thioredoxin family protein [Marinobacter adhaerens]|nr:thioredoxin family protein [Marinobacter adhaerens]